MIECADCYEYVDEEDVVKTPAGHLVCSWCAPPEWALGDVDEMLVVRGPRPVSGDVYRPLGPTPELAWLRNPNPQPQGS